MNVPRFTLYVASTLSALIANSACGDAAQSERPLPNIVLMMADDMGLGDTSAYQDLTGNADAMQIATPSMERLARHGVRFTDAHTPSTRCTATRYGLLTGRYAWRSRLKYWVLFGVQGDPLIEPDRPTLATMLRQQGYRTGMVGKWHVGLRYERSDGSPAAGWDDADLTRPLHDGPLDHGFDVCWFTSRSHGTSGPGGRKRNSAKQSVGPGHIHGRQIVGATGDGKRIVAEGDHAYVLNRLGSRHSDHAMQFLAEHTVGKSASDRPFFLYYASNSNHSPYTPDESIGGKPVSGAGLSKQGHPLTKREDYIYENDVALGRLLDWLQSTPDPRREGHPLIDNTIVIFTSDNGAEKDAAVATGPYRSNKGSAYEGGHRVPFLVAWPAGGVGDGDAQTAGQESEQRIALTDLFATFAAATGAPPRQFAKGEKGGEDSYNVLPAWRGESLPANRVLMVNDHKQAQDPAIVTVRIDHPRQGEMHWPGKWKLFLDAGLIRMGEGKPLELYELSSDPEEQTNRIDEPDLKPLIDYLHRMATLHRRCGGHQLAPLAAGRSIMLDWRTDADEEVFRGQRLGLAGLLANRPNGQIDFRVTTPGAGVVVRAAGGSGFNVNGRGLGINTGTFKQVDDGESIEVTFNRDVILEWAGIVAGNGVCGGSYQIDDGPPIAIYCVDADNDSRDQSGRLSDLGVVRAGQTVRFSSRPVVAAETPGRWRLATLSFRPIRQARN